MSPERKNTRSSEQAGNLPAIEFYPGERKVRILDVALDVLPLPTDVNARRFIPPWANMEKTVCWDTPTVTLVRDMAVRLTGGISSRNEGPTGVSKSFAAEVICAVTNRSYLRHNYSRESDIGDTIGRFVPSDKHLAVRFEELLADPDLPKKEREIIEKAKRESRPLTVYESKKVAKAMGLTGLDDDSHWKWKNGTLTGSMAYGSVYGADEVNLAPGNIVERENSAIEKNPSMRLVEHEGEIVRPLTPEEQSIIDHGGVVPGVIGLDRRYWYVAAQNPFGIGGGRTQESEARRNRLQDRVVEALTLKEYEEFLNFLVHGNQPDITWNGRRYTGQKNIQTAYRQLEVMPNVDNVLKCVADLQTRLEGLAAKGTIGSEKDLKGGSYVYTRRNLLRFLDSIIGAQGSVLDIEETMRQKRPIRNTNWHDLVMEAVYQEYISGAYREDQAVIKDLISGLGIEEFLGESKNNPQPPAWVKKARNGGVDVRKDNNGWTIS